MLETLSPSPSTLPPTLRLEHEEKIMPSAKVLDNVSAAELPVVIDSPRGIPKVSSVTRNRAIFSEGELDFGQMDIWEDDGNSEPLDANTRQMRFSFAASNIDALFRSPRNSEHISFHEDALEPITKPLDEVVVKSYEIYENRVSQKPSSRKPERALINSETAGNTDLEDVVSEWTSTPLYNQQFKRLLDFFETGKQTESGRETAACSSMLHPVSNEGMDQPQDHSIDLISTESSLVTIPSAFRETTSISEHVEMPDHMGSRLLNVNRTLGSNEKSLRNERSFVNHGRGSNLHVQQLKSELIVPMNSLQKPGDLVGKKGSLSSAGSESSKKHALRMQSGQSAILADSPIGKRDEDNRMPSNGFDDIQPMSMVSPTQTGSDWGAAFIDTRVKKSQPPDRLEDASSPVTKSLKTRTHPPGFNILKKLRPSPRPSSQKTANMTRSEQPFITNKKTNPAIADTKKILSRLRLTDMLNGRGKTVFPKDAKSGGNVDPRSNVKEGGLLVNSNEKQYRKAIPTFASGTAEQSGNSERLATSSELGVVENVNPRSESVNESPKSSEEGGHQREEDPLQEHFEGGKIAGKEKNGNFDGKHRGGVAEGKFGKTVWNLFSPRSGGLNLNVKGTGGKKPQVKSDFNDRIFICTENGPCLIGEPSPWAPEHVRNAPFDPSVARRVESIEKLGSITDANKGVPQLNQREHTQRRTDEEISALSRVLGARQPNDGAREIILGERDTREGSLARSATLKTSKTGAASSSWSQGVVRGGISRLFSPRSLRTKRGVISNQRRFVRVQSESVLLNDSVTYAGLKVANGTIRGDDALEDLEPDPARHVSLVGSRKAVARESGSEQAARKDWRGTGRPVQSGVKASY